MKLRLVGMVLVCLLAPLMAVGQQAGNNATTAATASVSVPRLISYSGTAKDAAGKPLSGPLGVTFALYKDEAGGSPVWLETQNVQADAKGHYAAMLGASQSSGLPLDVFASTDARWLGIQVSGQSEQPRTLLLSVPYALKASDAETIGGLPPSAFVMVQPPASNPATIAGTAPANSAPALIQPNLAGGGTVNFLPLWTPDGNTLGNSALFQSGIGATVKIGLGTSTPATTLDVKGAGTFRGALSLPATGVATAAAGKNSQPTKLTASAFNSGTSAAVNQNFQWQAEPVNNNSSSPSGSLNLLFSSGAGQPAETGLKVSNTGVFTFADAQTFPGTGTISGVTAGPGLTGGGTNGNVTVALTGGCGLAQVLQWNSLTWICSNVVTNVTPGTDLTESGTLGNITLNVDTAQVPQLNLGNTFTGNQTVNGNLSSTGLVTGSGFNIGSNLFAFGSYANGNAFLGFAGNTTTTGTSNTASGGSALVSNTTGSDNTATGGLALAANTTGTLNTANGFQALLSNTSGVSNTGSGVFALVFNTTGGSNTADGAQVLYSNTTGSSNTASGVFALNSNTTGNTNTASGTSALAANTTGGNNTASGSLALVSNTTGSNNVALGYNAGPDSGHPNLNNATAIGANAVVSQSNALVLGGTGANAVNVGIGTTAPAFTLDVRGTGNFTGPVTFEAGQTFPNTISGVAAGTDLTGGGNAGSVTLNVDTTKVVTGVAAGTDLTGGGTGGVPTLSLDTTKVPQLAAANTFTGNQTVNGNVTATGVVTGSNYQIGSNLFAFGDFVHSNAFLGFSGTTLPNSGVENTAVGVRALAISTAGNNNTALGFGAMAMNNGGEDNTATGAGALSSNTLGQFNTASGGASLLLNTTGSNNTGLGMGALANVVGGSSNTGIGNGAGPSSSHSSVNNATAVGSLAQANGDNSTAIGANAQATASNSLVLGSIIGVNGATANTNVGVGTTAPIVQLQVQGNDSTGTGVQTLTNNTSISGNSFAVVATTSSAGVTNEMVADGIGTGPLATPSGYFGTFTNQPIGFITGNVLRMFVDTTGRVGINTKSPDNTLSVNGSADKPGGGSWGTFSDGRLKNLHGDFDAGLAQILKLRPIRYTYKRENGMGIRDSQEHVGFVAQDVQKVIPEAVSQNDKGYLLVNNDPILWTMLNAIKEQQRQIAELRAQLRKRAARQTALETRLARLERTQQAGNSVAALYQPSQEHPAHNRR